MVNVTDSEYLSPFSWRYGSQEMREIWSLEGTRLLWRKLWVALAEIQSQFDLVHPDQIAELKKNGKCLGDIKDTMGTYKIRVRHLTVAVAILFLMLIAGVISGIELITKGILAFFR